MVQREFVLYSDHHALKFINTQTHMNRMHARWVAFIQRFTMVLKHKSRKHNKVVDALSRKGELLVILQTEITGFEQLKDLYAKDDDFSRAWKKCELRQPVADFHIQDGYLFHGNQLYIPRTSLREHLIHEIFYPLGKDFYFFIFGSFCEIFPWETIDLNPKKNYFFKIYLKTNS